MLKQFHDITGGCNYWGYLFFVILSAVLQVGAVLSLFPLLGNLFGPEPAQAGPWVGILIGIVAVAWLCDVISAKLGLELGLSIMRLIHQHAPSAVLAWLSAKLTHTKTASLRSLISTSAVDTTSGVILLITPVITAAVFNFTLGLGLFFISPLVAIVTLVGGFIVQGALWLGARLESRSQKNFTAATEELGDRLFEFAWAQPSLRTSCSTSIGVQLVEDTITRTYKRGLCLLLWQIPSSFLFSFVLQAVLLGFGITAWVSFDNCTVDAIAAATLVILLLRVIEQVTTVSSSVGGIIAINELSTSVKELIDTTPVVNSEPLSEAPRITAQGLEVRYPDGTLGLNNVTTDFQPGTITVVIGRSGFGKITLLRALSGPRHSPAAPSASTTRPLLKVPCAATPP